MASEYHALHIPVRINIPIRGSGGADAGDRMVGEEEQEEAAAEDPDPDPAAPHAGRILDDNIFIQFHPGFQATPDPIRFVLGPNMDVRRVDRGNNNVNAGSGSGRGGDGDDDDDEAIEAPSPIRIPGQPAVSQEPQFSFPFWVVISFLVGAIAAAVNFYFPGASNHDNSTTTRNDSDPIHHGGHHYPPPTKDQNSPSRLIYGDSVPVDNDEYENLTTSSSIVNIPTTEQLRPLIDLFLDEILPLPQNMYDYSKSFDAPGKIRSIYIVCDGLLGRYDNSLAHNTTTNDTSSSSATATITTGTGNKENEDNSNSNSNSNNTRPLDALSHVQAQRLDFACRAAINATAHVSEEVLNHSEADLKKWLLFYSHRLGIMKGDIENSYAWGLRRGEFYGYLNEEDAEEKEAKMSMLGHKPPFRPTTENYFIRKNGEVAEILRIGLCGQWESYYPPERKRDHRYLEDFEVLMMDFHRSTPWYPLLGFFASNLTDLADGLDAYTRNVTRLVTLASDLVVGMGWEEATQRSRTSAVARALGSGWRRFKDLTNPLFYTYTFQGEPEVGAAISLDRIVEMIERLKHDGIPPERENGAHHYPLFASGFSSSPADRGGKMAALMQQIDQAIETIRRLEAPLLDICREIEELEDAGWKANVSFPLKSEEPGSSRSTRQDGQEEEEARFETREVLRAWVETDYLDLLDMLRFKVEFLNIGMKRWQRDFYTWWEWDEYIFPWWEWETDSYAWWKWS